MSHRCGCRAVECPHHHAFGGTYPCPCPESCTYCAPDEYDAGGRYWPGRTTAINTSGEVEEVRDA